MRRAVRACVLLAMVVPSLAFAQESASGPDARTFLEALRGSWRFELFPEGSASPTLTGRRTFEALVEGHSMLAWSETFDGRDLVLAGVLGYDPSTGRFYEVGSPSTGPVDSWVGEMGPDGRSVRWSDPADAEEPFRGEMVLVSDEVFEFRGTTFRAVFVRAPSGHGRADAHSEAEAARVLAAEDAYVEAEVNRDEAALRRLVDDRFQYNSADGTTWNKQQLIQSVLGMDMTAQEISERSVIVEGDVAVVLATATLHFGSGDQERISELRYTSVYVNRGGEWRMLALQMQPRTPREP